MDASDLQRYPHRRFNPLREEWVLVSPQRAQRPWQGQVEEVGRAAEAPYDPGCYLCPGNERAGGVRNPAYSSTFVFENDYPALIGEAEEFEKNDGGLIVAEGERGICRVVCFSPRHDLTLAGLSEAEMRAVVERWAEETRELGAVRWVRHVQIFENRGALMGASNPHPHGQIWATASLPDEPAKELAAQTKYRSERASCLLCDYLALEKKRGERTVCENESFAALVPYWAMWPYEILVVAKRHAQDLTQLGDAERGRLGDILQRVARRYDKVFDAPFPYSMGFHQRPTDGEAHEEWHLHAHFYPPLLRSATVRKFMVGFELLGTPQRDLTPESAAERLRGAGET